MRVAHWADHQWNAKWGHNPTRLCIFIPDTGIQPPEWPSQEQPGPGSTTSALAWDVSAPACTNGYGLLCGLWVWRRRTNRRPCPLMSSPRTTSWTARPDGSGRWDNRIAAPRSSAATQWFEELAQKMKNNMFINLKQNIKWNNNVFKLNERTDFQVVTNQKASDSMRVGISNTIKFLISCKAVVFNIFCSIAPLQQICLLPNQLMI